MIDTMTMTDLQDDALPLYEKPTVTSLSEADLLDSIEAQGFSPSNTF